MVSFEFYFSFPEISGLTPLYSVTGNTVFNFIVSQYPDNVRMFISTQYAFANTARETSFYSKTILKHAYIQSRPRHDRTELNVA
jgi:hypothetical protein